MDKPDKEEHDTTNKDRVQGGIVEAIHNKGYLKFSSQQFQIPAQSLDFFLNFQMLVQAIFMRFWLYISLNTAYHHKFFLICQRPCQDNSHFYGST